MPAPSRSPATMSIVSTSHIRSAIAATSRNPPVRSRSDGGEVAGRSIMVPDTLRGPGQAPLKPVRDRRAQAGPVGLQPVVAAQAHDLAAGGLGRHPERIRLALHD